MCFPISLSKHFLNILTRAKCLGWNKSEGNPISYPCKWQLWMANITLGLVGYGHPLQLTRPQSSLVFHAWSQGRGRLALFSRRTFYSFLFSSSSRTFSVLSKWCFKGSWTTEGELLFLVSYGDDFLMVIMIMLLICAYRRGWGSAHQCQNFDFEQIILTASYCLDGWRLKEWFGPRPQGKVP